MTASGVCHSDLHVRDGEWPRPGPFVIGHEGAGVVDRPRPGRRPGATGPAPGHGGRAQLDRPVRPLPAVPGRAGLAVRRQRRGAPPDGRRDEPAPRAATAASSSPYCGLGHDGRGGDRRRERGDPDARGRRSGGRRPHRLLRLDRRRGGRSRRRPWRPGASAVVIGLGGVGLSVVMGLVLAGADPIVAVDRVPAKLALARELGATHGDRGGPGRPRPRRPPSATATGGGPDHAFEAIGLRTTIELAIELPAAGRHGHARRHDPVRRAGELRGLPVRRRRPPDPGQQLRRRPMPAVDFPRYARLHLEGRLPIERLIERPDRPRRRRGGVRRRCAGARGCAGW